LEGCFLRNTKRETRNDLLNKLERKNVALLQVVGLTKYFGSDKLFEDLSFEIHPGEKIGLIGRNGCGKTTLLNIIGSLDSPTKGVVNVLGKSISELSHKESAVLRNRHIGFIFQTYNLLPVYTVYENVEFALLLQKMSGSQRKKAVMDALEWVGLTEKIKSRPSMLSGGECQRVAIARSMVKRPEIVLADEPTANLDSNNSHHILQTMKRLNRELKTTFIFATHDEKVMKYLDRIISLEDGKVVKDMVITSSNN
jgi:putative ABC transport system ATP-binding protein